MTAYEIYKEYVYYVFCKTQADFEDLTALMVEMIVLLMLKGF